jgi:hypothetical protein
VTQRTISGARDYWNLYYGDQFIAGQGTEEVIAALLDVRPVGIWLDLGAGSESLLWSIPLRAERLIAVDLDPKRLALLRTYAASHRPRGAYQTVLERSRRTSADFVDRCGRLVAEVIADCLTGQSLPFMPESAELVTQFGLLGLAASSEQFFASWQAIHEPLAAGGWCAGANWQATADRDRVRLSNCLFTSAFGLAGITPMLIIRVSVAGDADFDSVWIYLGRKQ